VSLATATRSGLGDAVAMVPAVAPMGLALGVALGELSPPALVSWLSAPLMVAGSAQLVLMSHLDAGAGLLSAVAAAVVINARFVVYGAALARRFSGQPTWFRWLGPQWIVDQSYGMVTARCPEDAPADRFRRYFTSSSTLLWATWTVTVGLGLLLGPVLPAALPLEFVLPAMFAALVVPGLRDRSELTATVAGASVAVGGGGLLLSVAAAVAGGAVGGAGRGLR
jgi:predicted branched-subunit amino acid permease